MGKTTQRSRSSTPRPVLLKSLLGSLSPSERALKAVEKPAGTASIASPGAASSNNRDVIRVKDACKQIRMGFICKVYSLLTMQLLLTTLIVSLLQTTSEKWLTENTWLFWASFGATVLVLLLMCNEKYIKTYPTNYIILFSFTVIEAVLVGCCSANDTAGSVCVCIAVTVLVFSGLTAYAWMTASEFTGMVPFLFGALSSLLWFSLVISILGCFGVRIPAIGAIYGAFSMMAFVFYILFDTQCILGEYNGHQYEFSIDDYAFAALNLHLDFLNLFLKLFKILGEKKRKKN